MNPPACQLCEKPCEAIKRGGKIVGYRKLCAGCRKEIQRAKEDERRERERARKQTEDINRRKPLDAARARLWNLTSLADRANGSIADREGLERAISDARAKVAELTEARPEAKAPGKCGCANPIPVPEDGHSTCATCARWLTPPPSWSRERSYLHSPWWTTAGSPVGVGGFSQPSNGGLRTRAKKAGSR